MNNFCTSQLNTNDGTCCHSNELCSFSGNLNDVTAAPIYVQSVYDAVRFNLHGMKTIQSLKFSPAVPCGCTISRIMDIRVRKVFNPSNMHDAENLTLDMETCISGAYFVGDCNGVIETVGPDGIPSEKIIYADTSQCDGSGSGTPIFGTQNAKVWGNVIIYMDLCLCDNCGRESNLTVSAEVNVAKQNCPLVLTNFFELCMPSAENSAFHPRLAELSNACFSARLATNHAARDICISNNGEITANLILTISITAEKKITVPVQLCVLSTGFAEAPLQDNSTVMTCSGLFPERTDGSSEACGGQTVSNCSSQAVYCDSSNQRNTDDCDCSCCDYPPTCR